MDTTRPQLLWVSKKCYRVNTDSTQMKSDDRIHRSRYNEDDSYQSCDDLDENDIETNGNGTFKISYHIPSIFFSQIIGSKGLTKKRIEAETKAQIQIPKIGVEGDVVITGRSKQAVASARNKVNLVAIAARNKHQVTHFLGIPFNSVTIQKSFERFKEEILKNCPNVDKSLFSEPGKLHLTIGMLTLLDNDDRVLASAILDDCRSVIGQILDQVNKSINVHLCGLKIMNDDPSMVDILYGDIKSEELQLMANSIREKFIDKGLSKKYNTEVKLHVTLMNSKVKETNEINVKRTPFDARKILENYSDFDFGWQQITGIHLCQIHTTSYDGFYEVTGILNF